MRTAKCALVRIGVLMKEIMQSQVGAKNGSSVITGANYGRDRIMHVGAGAVLEGIYCSNLF